MIKCWCEDCSVDSILYRVSKKGERPPVWGCKDHLKDKKIEPELIKIVELTYAAGN